MMVGELLRMLRHADPKDTVVVAVPNPDSPGQHTTPVSIIVNCYFDPESGKVYSYKSESTKPLERAVRLKVGK